MIRAPEYVQVVDYSRAAQVEEVLARTSVTGALRQLSTIHDAFQDRLNNFFWRYRAAIAVPAKNSYTVAARGPDGGIGGAKKGEGRQPH